MKKTRSSKESAPKVLKVDNNEVVDSGDSGKTNETVVNLSKNDKSRKLTYMPNIGAIRELNFLTPNVKTIFNYLQLVFIKSPIV